MKVLKANESQYNLLNGFKNGNNILLFEKDKFNNWIVGKEVLSDPNFTEIHSQLSELEEIDFEPKQTEI
jgi:hypothetical protein